MAFQPMSKITTEYGTSSWNPAETFGKALDMGLNARNRMQYFKEAHAAARNEEHEQETPATVRETPTPANTGAPVPGHRQRGSNITPESTGAPMPGTLKKNTATHPITGNLVPAVPVKRKGAKPTAPGTRPKQRRKK